MFQDAFIKLDVSETTALIKEINIEHDGTPLDPERTIIMSQTLSFYPRCRFLDIVDERIHPTIHKYAFHNTDDLIFLNWTNAPIYKLNETLPISLNKNNVVDYVRFFFACVRGRKGHFEVIETVDDIRWKEDPPIAARKAMGKLIEPVHLVSENEDGSYSLKACMVFKDSIFSADVHVSRKGHVDLSNEALLIEDVPILEDTLE